MSATAVGQGSGQGSVGGGTRRRSSSLENDSESSKRGEVAVQRRPRPVSLVRSMSTNVDSQLAGQIFDHFCSASTLKSILRSYRYLCEVLRLKPNQITYFYPKLKANLLSWKAQALWSKLDKRASQKCYNRGKACAGTRVLIIGAGPCGLRTAIEAQLLGAKVVVVEKRDRYSRNNVLHLWPFNIHELRAMGAKKFYGKFCAGAIDHISIRQLQCILLKVCLLLGVEVFEGVGFEELIEPSDTEAGWRARVSPKDHPVSQYEFDVLIGADGKRNTLAGFKRKEFRGKLAIAITANFINKYTEAEGQVEEISGVAFIFNQKFFNDLNQALGIDLENIVYYKDETHYFVMTAKKSSLLAKGVLLENYPDPSALLAPSNISQEALFQYAREAADFATKGQLPHLDFAVNHYGKPDVAMFDFTSMYAADHSARVIERHGHRLLQCLVGDSLLEPFWPTGTGCPRGFFSAMDAMWLMKQLESGKMSVLECLAERESIYRILSQTTPENTCKNFGLCSIDPSTRYPTLNLKLVLPFQITQLYDTDNPAHLQPQNVLQDSAPRKKRRKESHVSPGTLLSWIQKQVELYDLQVNDMTTSFQNGLVLCAIIHRYRPDLLNWDSLDPEDIVQNNQLAFDILESELGLQPVTTGQEIEKTISAGRPMDKLAMISYLTGVYELFRREIPHTQHPGGQMDDLDDSVYCHNHRAKMTNSSSGQRKEQEATSIGQLVANDALRRKRRSLEHVEIEGSWEDARGRRTSNRKRLAKLMERAMLQEHKRTESVERMEPLDIRNEEKYRKIREILAGERKRDEDQQREKKPEDLRRAIGRIDSQDWNVKMIEEQMRGSKKTGDRARERVPKWSKEAFNDKLRKVKCTLENKEELRKNSVETDVSLLRLQRKVAEGSTLEAGERGANKVSALVGELASKLVPQPTTTESYRPELRREGSTVWQPPKQKSSRSSENCHFCTEKVYVVERMSAEGKFFHRACFRCDYCNILLRLGSYVYHREGRFASKFFCIPHSTENALEKYKFKKKAEEIQAAKERRADNDEKMASKLLPPPSALRRERILLSDLPGRGTTPERAEYEASVEEGGISGSNGSLAAASGQQLNIIDEDEWTDLNFGTNNNSTNGANTSDDSVSDLDSDQDEQEGGDGKLGDAPLTADETRRLAREWRARQGLKQHQAGGGGEEVRYTDREYEDSSDPEQHATAAATAAHRVHRTRRRGGHNQRTTSSQSSTDSSSFDSSDEDDDLGSATDEEIRAIEQRDSNPFHSLQIPRIVVQSNSPVPTLSTGIGRSRRSGASQPPDVVPEDKYVSQRIPLGNSGSSSALSQPVMPPGTALYRPRYQHYRTPDLTAAVAATTTMAPLQTGSFYRPASAVSNSLKKNWVVPGGGGAGGAAGTASSGQPQHQQQQRRVDQSEIDARLKSLMDRLSSQQSLLKPAEKPSQQMQYYLDSTAAMRRLPERKLSPAGVGGGSFAPYRPSVTSPISTTSNSAAHAPSATTETALSETKNDAAGKTEEEVAVTPAAAASSDGTTTETDEEDDSESLTTEASDVEIEIQAKLEVVTEVPEIKINLAEEEEEHLAAAQLETNSAAAVTETAAALTDDTIATTLPSLASCLDDDSIQFADDDDNVLSSPDSFPAVTALSITACTAFTPSAAEITAASSDIGTVALTASRDSAALSEPVADPLPGASPSCDASGEEVVSVTSADHQLLSLSEQKSSFSSSTQKIEGPRNRVPPVRRPSLLKTVVSIKSRDSSATAVSHASSEQSGFNGITATAGDCLNNNNNNKNIINGNTDVGDFEQSSESESTNYVETVNIGLIEQQQLLLLNNTNNHSSVACEEGVSLILNSKKEVTGSREADKQQPEEEQIDSVLQVYQARTAEEKRARITQFQQKQSNIVHDLIMGIPRQRRARQPRVTIPTSSIPPPPRLSPPADAQNGEHGIVGDSSSCKLRDYSDAVAEQLSDTKQQQQQPQDDLVETRRRSIRETSLPRSIREASPRILQTARVSLPPTPITNPEKFGIRPREHATSAKRSTALSSPTSPSDSQSSANTDNLDGIVSPPPPQAAVAASSSSAPATPRKTNKPAFAISSPTAKKGRGLMSAVTSMFSRASASSTPITSPDSSKAGPVPKGGSGSSNSLNLVKGTANIKLEESQLQLSPIISNDQPSNKGSETWQEYQEPDTEEDVRFESLDSIVLDLSSLARAGLPPHLLERLEKRCSKKGQRIAQKAAMARIRRAQEIQRELEVIEVECAEVEKEGVVLEKRLRERGEGEQGEFMSDWYRLLGEKNRLVRREQELTVESRQLELADSADREECELVRVGGGQAAVAVLESLAGIAEQREQLQLMLDRDRERYRREDREIRQRMEQQGIRPAS